MSTERAPEAGQAPEAAAPETPEAAAAPSRPHVRWSGGGEATLLTLEGETVALASSRPFAPGSRPEGTLATSHAYRMKTHRCRRDPADAEPPRYRIEGRLLDASREVREALAGLVGR